MSSEPYCVTVLQPQLKPSHIPPASSLPCPPSRFPLPPALMSGRSTPTGTSTTVWPPISLSQDAVHPLITTSPHPQDPHQAAVDFHRRQPDLQSHLDRAVRPGRPHPHPAAARLVQQDAAEVDQDGPRVLQRRPPAEHRRLRPLRRLERHAPRRCRLHHRAHLAARRARRLGARRQHLDLLPAPRRRRKGAPARDLLVLRRGGRRVGSGGERLCGAAH